MTCMKEFSTWTLPTTATKEISINKVFSIFCKFVSVVVVLCFVEAGWKGSSSSKKLHVSSFLFIIEIHFGLSKLYPL